MGAPLGNRNAARARVWQAAIMRALEQRSRLDQKEALDTLAHALIDKAADGDMTALRELGDRLDGKPHQSVDAEISGGLDVNIQGTDAQL